MDTRTLKGLLCATPSVPLIDAIDDGQTHFLPLLDAELHLISSRLQRLKEYRNSLSSPMYRLHPELLSYIFFIYAQNNNELFDLRWTRLLFVCRRWHDVGKHTQSLWSYIDIKAVPPRRRPDGSHIVHDPDMDIRRIETQRARAGLWPLTIRMAGNVHLSEAKQAYVSMFWNPTSLASFTVNGDNKCVEKMVHILAAHRHPLLKTLHMHCLSRHLSAFPDVREPMSIALRDNLPQLSHLSVLGLTFDWTSIQGLRHLSVDYMLDMPLPFSLRDIVDALSRCPLLEVFSMRLPPSFGLDTLTPLDVTALSHLSIISLRGGVCVCTDLLRALTSISSSAKVIVDTTSRVTDLPSISSLATYAGRHASREGEPVLHSVAIAMMPARPTIGEVQAELPNPSNTRFDIVSQRNPTRYRDDTHRLRVPASVELDHPSCITLSTTIPSVAADEALMNILQSWPLSKVTHVDLRSAVVSISCLRAIFMGLPAASTVIVHPEAANVSTLLEFLEENLKERGQRVVANILFDAAAVPIMRSMPTPQAWNGFPRLFGEVLARRSIMRALQYCSKAARAGVPLDTIEIFNEPRDSSRRLIDLTADIDWSELCGDLQDGFVYEGIIHSARAEYDGIEKDSFSAASI
ncbi:hypothetical protein PENSPDRAFT_658093 [Peniophora sp. CONT]|nr:hypothetical protein PENSPDRAFT_658093 [Peniophora sp. CONT]